MRLFTAIYPPAEAVEHLTTRVAGLRLGAAAAAGTKVGMVDPAQAHLTLAFLGDVAPGRLVEVESALGLAARWSRDTRTAAPRLRLTGGGRFGRDRFTVLWADVGGDVEALQVLSRLIRSRLRHARLPYDERPLRPHLTIARPGDRLPPADIEADLAALADYEGPEWPAGELVLTHSEPGPHPAYHRLAAWPLG
ncbi:2'-5' RNA ligase [Micromonospora phaseoli]|uniref:RNA 2',3'-cyclic phosphodiesterase n=1 Tax=Micromonospora phaseoli TaxID=1144548 RepID=A0A1H7AGJ6_9ACTN|nr:RNA 2',3'-cyclic phosphodiesterase [Micromonospora phaseoli]PZV96401.1 2'-5' RNA ligase [Micromonospora phaseoli]GIJ76088.1 RNA 2',3'-cyclic phosphodiesterase [Micromonospora phaseoli]SEJ64478.1 2'-5' RNA ligase [Micromonospora phaseoli]